VKILTCIAILFTLSINVFADTFNSFKDLNSCTYCPYQYIPNGDGEIIRGGGDSTYKGFDFDEIYTYTSGILTIRGSLDDHYCDNPAGYPCLDGAYTVTVKLNGIAISRSCPFTHGMPFRGPFTNLVEWSIPIDGCLIRPRNTVSITVSSPNDSLHWIILDWIRMTVMGTRNNFPPMALFTFSPELPRISEPVGSSNAIISQVEKIIGEGK
jgi:hypothetical protein